MLTYQQSKFCSRQSCSQSADDDDDGAFEQPHSADHEQLWLTYKAMNSIALFLERLGMIAMTPCSELSFPN